MTKPRTILAVILATLSMGSAAFAQTITTFTVPGATATAALAINGTGTIAGTYAGTDGVQHGFVRAANGTITSFDPPASTSTTPTGIDKNGTIVGTYTTGSTSNAHGFLRVANGAITTFDPKRSNNTAVTAIHGMTIGYYAVDERKIVGFTRTRPGHYGRVRYPSAQQTEPMAINDVAVIAGSYRSGRGDWHGFELAPDGTYTSFDPTDAVSTNPTGISRDGTVAGYFQDGTGQHGFVRTADGTISPFDVSGAVNTAALGINTGDTVFGNYTDTTGASHGYQRPSNGVIQTFDVTGATSTFAASINNKGVIVGSYVDANGGGSYIRTP
jgi:hypothetical protein